MKNLEEYHSIKRVNILIVVLELFAGGIENGIVNLINNSSCRFQYTICCLRKKGVLEKRLNKAVNFYELKMKYGNDYSLPFKIYNIIRKEKIHLVRAFNEEPFFYSFFPSKFCCVPIIYYNGGRIFPEKKKKIIVERLFSYFADSSIVPSNDLMNYMIENIGIPEKKISVINNGVDLDRFNVFFDIIEKKRSLEILEKDLIIGTIGRLVEQKDIPTFLRIAKKILEVRSDITFLVVGDGNLKADLLQLAHDLSISHKVKFLGIRHDIEEIHNLIDIFLLTSRWEGMPNVILESMACKKTVFTTNIEGANQIIVNGENGYILQPGDVDGFVTKILSLDEKIRKKIGLNAYQQVKVNFSVDNMVKKYETLYINAIKNKKKPFLSASPI